MFSNRFESLGAKYVVHFGHINNNTSFRMALTMNRNARLPPSIQSNIFIHLSVKTEKEESITFSYVIKNET